MRLLLTGATGFIGAHVARALVERGAEVHGLTLPGAPRERIAALAPQVELIEGDLGDAAWVRATVGSIAPDAAIHLAWFAEPRLYLRAVPENLASLRGGVNLIEALADGGTCRRVVMAGTCLENMDTPRPTIYAAAKAAQHQLATGFGERSMSAACAHIFYLYGPWEDERRAIPTVTRSLLRGICTGSPVTLRRVFEEVAQATGRADLLRIGALPDSESTGWPATGDPAPMLTTGWRPRYNLKQGIQETTAWWTTRERNGQ